MTLKIRSNEVLFAKQTPQTLQLLRLTMVQNEKKYQIFVSSTYTDLTKEREQIVKAILEIGHIPVGMEMFSAADEEQWTIIQRHISQSDYYVVIVAHRYGSLDGDVSYTEKEYDFALKNNIPILGFVIDDSAAWPSDKSETDSQKRAKLIQFKSKVKSKPVAFWTDAKDLYSSCIVALMKAFVSQPRQGWIRSKENHDADILDEISRLSKENDILRKQIQNTDKKQQEKESSIWDEAVDYIFEKNFTMEVYYSRSTNWERTESISMYGLFRNIAPTLLPEATATNINKLCAILVADPNRKLRQTVPVPTNTIDELMVNWMAYGLVEPSKLKHSVSDNEKYWSLTELGQKMLGKIIRLEHTNKSKKVDK